MSPKGTPNDSHVLRVAHRPRTPLSSAATGACSAAGPGNQGTCSNMRSGRKFGRRAEFRCWLGSVCLALRYGTCGKLQGKTGAPGLWASIGPRLSGVNLSKRDTCRSKSARLVPHLMAVRVAKTSGDASTMTCLVFHRSQ